MPRVPHVSEHPETEPEPESEPASEKVYLVMDNVPWHKKAKRLIETGEEYADIRSTVTILSLLPYLPDLNPIEQIRRVTGRDVCHFDPLSG